MGSRDTGNATSIVTALVGSMALSFGVIVGGSTLATTVVKTVVKHKRRAAVRPCTECEGKRHVPCATCAGASAIDWQPIKGALSKRLAVCPTCDGRRLQRCVNCCGKGEVAE